MACLYMEIAGKLKTEFSRMRSSGENRLPSEAELCRQYSCSRQTVRSALSLLEQDGLITKRRGSGSYLADPARPEEKRIVLLVDDPDEYIYPELVRALRNTLAERGYVLQTCVSGGFYARERELLSSLCSDPPAGLILEPIRNVLPHPNTELLEELSAKGCLTLCLFAAYPAFPAPCLRYDDVENAGRLIRYLAEKNICRYAGVFRNDDSRGLERFRGCVQAMLDLGLPFEEQRFTWLSSDDHRAILNGDRLLLRQILRRCEGKPGALLCHNDEIAYRLLQEALDEGVAVPEDLSVLSFDNSYYTVSGPVGITSLGCPPKAIGEAAAKAILSLLQGRVPSFLSLPAVFTARESG